MASISSAQLNLIVAPKIVPRPGTEIWYEPSHVISKQLKTDEDRFQYYYAEHIIEEISAWAYGEETNGDSKINLVDVFLLLNAKNLENSVKTGAPFRLEIPNPIMFACFALKLNMKGPFRLPSKCERFKKTIVWDIKNLEEVKNAKEMFQQLVREGLKPTAKFDDQKESATLKGHRVKREEKHFFSLQGMYQEAKSLKEFMALSPQQRKEWSNEQVLQ